ncbi:hypothetical protein SORBI_3007G134180 [Sorghum bicolor]|uniref:Defensin-like protein n=1 Tax=Sorghum bicolor TaxID=4558 RepID=A0A1Z5RA88_SORBI|nr:hypothetical protein SORBI_3007G134180 [Sorghum bicolor]
MTSYSRRTLSATTAIILLLAIVVTETSPVGACLQLCDHLSTTYTAGVCSNDDCNAACIKESSANYDGGCDEVSGLCNCGVPC